MQKEIDLIRDFNRYYTEVIGLLDRYILDSNYSLPEVRVMYEIYKKNEITANEIKEILQLDKGYLSRILKKLEKYNMIIRVTSKKDKRSTNISLTKAGNIEFDKLNQTANKQIAEIILNLEVEKRKQLVEHMKAIKGILQDENT